MNITIIGTGYVGLVTGACFAEAGNTVICVDSNANKTALLNEGFIPIYEPGLEPIIRENAAHKRLSFTTDLAAAVNKADVCFICVGTPQDEDGSADLRYVFQVAESLCAVAKKELIVATKSTVPVGTGDKIEALLREKFKYPFAVFSNPEFLKEGDAVNDFMKPDRIVVGTDSERVRELMTRLYGPFNRQTNRLIFMSRRSAEITKYAANAMLALRISFMNELANFCDASGGNINDVRVGIGSDPRIGPQFLYSGLGFGGSCFPKDVNALLRAGRDQGIELKTVAATNAVNDQQPGIFLEKIKKRFGKISGKKFALWGLAFKARTDDIRYSPALKLADLLIREGAKLTVFDPEAMENVKVACGDMFDYVTDKMDALADAEALIIATDWNEFRSPDFAMIRSKLKTPCIFDGRNLYSRLNLKDQGFEYFGIGLGNNE